MSYIAGSLPICYCSHEFRATHNANSYDGGDQCKYIRQRGIPVNLQQELLYGFEMTDKPRSQIFFPQGGLDTMASMYCVVMWGSKYSNSAVRFENQPHSPPRTKPVFGKLRAPPPYKLIPFQSGDKSLIRQRHTLPTIRRPDTAIAHAVSNGPFLLDTAQARSYMTRPLTSPTTSALGIFQGLLYSQQLCALKRPHQCP